MKSANRIAVKRPVAATRRRLIRWAVMVTCATGVASNLFAEAIEQWLFDQTNTAYGGVSGAAAVNSVPGAPVLGMQQYAVAYTNLHVAGGPFAQSVGAMSLPTGAKYSAEYGGVGSLVNWTTHHQFSIELWVDPVALSSGTLADVFDDRGQLLRLQATTGGYFLDGFLYSGSTFVDSGVGSILIPTNAWTHLAMTYDGTQVRTYVNGVVDRTLATSTSLGNAFANVAIGEFGTGGNFYHGLVDEIRVSNLALPSGSGSGFGELAWNATLVGLPIPEMQTVALMGLGTVLAFARRRR